MKVYLHNIWSHGLVKSLEWGSIINAILNIREPFTITEIRGCLDSRFRTVLKPKIAQVVEILKSKLLVVDVGLRGSMVLMVDENVDLTDQASINDIPSYSQEIRSKFRTWAILARLSIGSEATHRELSRKLSERARPLIINEIHPFLEWLSNSAFVDEDSRVIGEFNQIIGMVRTYFINAMIDE